MSTFTVRLAVVFAFLVLPRSGLVAAGSPELLSAIRNGDHARAQKLLAAGADVNTADADGTTALMHAVIESDVKMMKLLMERGANVNTKNSADSTALMYAVTDLAKTRLLLDAGAAVKVKNKRGATPMSVAAMPAGSMPVLKLLASKGAEAEDRLMPLAAAKGDLDAIRFLLSIGISPGDASGNAVAAAIQARCEAPCGKGSRRQRFSSEWGGRSERQRQTRNARSFSIPGRPWRLTRIQRSREFHSSDAGGAFHGAAARS